LVSRPFVAELTPSGLIRHVNGADSTSADAFVPILIFVVLHANPDNMLSNVE
jgi:hypothetical protein